MSNTPGLQAQRTTLAWSRTGIAAGVPAALLLRDSISSGSPLMTLTAVVALLVALVFWSAGGTIRRHRGVPAERRRCAYAAAATVTIVTLMVAALTAISVVSG
jgi:uncharacterized membrane protein YidH (DUF202 family)